MARRDFIDWDLGPDDLVSFNLRMARDLRGWSQAEAVARLDEAGGIEWSTASLSDAERAWTPDGRKREFTARHLVAFSLAYEVPLQWWFLPPAVATHGTLSIGLHRVSAPLGPAMLTGDLFRRTSDIEERHKELGVLIDPPDQVRVQITALLARQREELMKLIEEWQRIESHLLEEGATE